MNYYRINEAGKIDQVASSMDEIQAIHPLFGEHWARQPGGVWGAGWFNRNDIECFDQAVEFASRATKDLPGGKLYIATDAGPTVSPRYDVILAPAVGDEVSKYFNGDAYPVGTITKISPSLNTITTSSGLKFRRRGDTGRWLQAGGTWCLLPGVRNDRNLEF
jgi:hypothetical protein